MDHLYVNISQQLDYLSRASSVSARELRNWLPKQIWNRQDRQSVLDLLSRLLVTDDKITVSVSSLLHVLVLDLLFRARCCAFNGQNVVDSNHHQQLCIALGRIVNVSPTFRNFVQVYLHAVKQWPTSSLSAENEDYEPVSKKAKKAHLRPVNSQLLRDLSEAAFRLIHAVGRDGSTVWNSSDLICSLKSSDLTIRWFAVHSLSELLHMSPRQQQKFRSLYFTVDERRDLLLRFFLKRSSSHTAVRANTEPFTGPPMSHTKQCIMGSDLCPEVTSVCGVLLPKASASSLQNAADVLVPVRSSLRNLRRLALAVSHCEAVMLEGLVGSGKTSLVEHLAAATGRTASPQLMKLQLGDQMDSKALLGTYRCTDVPGRFVWQPGSLLCAVQAGYWLLLEDLDCAPMDVISVLVPLLETRTLSVPGHGDRIHAAPDFRIFATRRLVGSSTGWHRQHTSSADILDKLWTTISVEPLSHDELLQVVTTRFPSLAKDAEKLVEIFCALLPRDVSTVDIDDQVSTADVTGDGLTEAVQRYLSHSGRPISTRDLMKWCGRLEHHVTDTRSPLTTELIFIEAVDCFCACLPMTAGHVELAREIGRRLNFSHAEVAHYCQQKQPSAPAPKGIDSVSVGRVTLHRSRPQLTSLRCVALNQFAFTRPASSLLERVAVAIGNNEPTLLVGETGTGKTSAVQYLAELMSHQLHVINMNQQSDSMDLLGGFKPVKLSSIIEPLKTDFESLVRETFPDQDNKQFFENIEICFRGRSWNALFKLMRTPSDVASKVFETGSEKRLKWDTFNARVVQLQELSEQIKSTPPFQFIEGTLVAALKYGDWVLLDEINLASAETLECLCGLLESSSGSVVLTERGDVLPIVRHPDFRLFACMNPATDVGKKDLPLGIRNRFTELYVDELEDSGDLRLLVETYLRNLIDVPVNGIVDFYQQVRKRASTSLADGTGRRPHFSLRTLCRALRQASRNIYGRTDRSIYEAFCLSFLTQLSRASYPEVDHLIRTQIFRKSVDVARVLRRPLTEPKDGEKYVLVEGYWIRQGSEPLPAESPADYILTESVRQNLRDLARIVAAGKLPVLLQGETSVGKTSLIKYLARLTGNKCHRINNHEHTDIQEYIGCYTASERSGRLVFNDGVLVKAMQQGHWIILDELNLAPSDVLEALNRLLDDNRELRVPETQKVVKAKDSFVLFATQNPPGHYGGRKVLSRAFRNRFVELHFDEIPSVELVEILQKRCELPQSYSQLLVKVMLDLQQKRRASGLFTGKQGYMTLRDLFRWAERFRLADDAEKSNGKQLLAENGYMLLSGRVRNISEEMEIISVLESTFKCKVNPVELFTVPTLDSAVPLLSERDRKRAAAAPPLTLPLLERITSSTPRGFEGVVWTYSMRRMAMLVEQALRFQEPVLLVGETGCGKTTVCQMYAERRGHSLRSVNCNLHTESSDFLGGLRPVRHTTDNISDDAAGVPNRKLFEWHDGPLVDAMKTGSTFLVDEISLAEDSVLERLNSVLEPERTLLLAERGTSRGGNEAEQVVALEGFRIVATMNPGGDYGKKELSPALRNRFTEIWCPLSRDVLELSDIIVHNLLRYNVTRSATDATVNNTAQLIAAAMLDFGNWFQTHDFGKRCVVTIRDLLAWVDFMWRTTSAASSTEATAAVATMLGSKVISQSLDLAAAYIHGACIVFVDALGSSGSSVSMCNSSASRSECLHKLASQTQTLFGRGCDLDLTGLGLNHDLVARVELTEDTFGIHPFYIQRGPETVDPSTSSFSFLAPSTCVNTVRVLRALQLARPILLEGSPGVGKTSLVAALAKMAGHQLVRINLSEQTDISDLFGSDLPVEGGRSGEFAWRDGPFLAALKAGHWIVLDELNLASQSVLEGLNACFDHRAEVYIPELATSFQVQRDSTRFFACQNPVREGGGRKNLPKSFLNRFTQVFIDPLMTSDLLFIVRSAYQQLPVALIELMIEFNQQLHEETTVKGVFGRKGGPWEFNLRDLFRWCQLLITRQVPEHYDAGEFVDLIYMDRMRCATDRRAVTELFLKVFGNNPSCVVSAPRRLTITETNIQVGNAFLPRTDTTVCAAQQSRHGLRPLHHLLAPLASLMKCIEMNWMAILVGTSGVGKTSLVELLAKLTGNQLHVLPMNSAFDTLELLGGFEQADLRRDVEKVEGQTESIVQRVASQLLLLKADSDAQNLLSLWAELNKLANVSGGSTYTNIDEMKSVELKLASLRSIVDCVSRLTSRFLQHFDSLPTSVVRLSSDVERIAELLKRDKSLNRGGRFEWIDSVLVECLKSGHWLLIDNVNFCSASVLDRLNALLEPAGSLAISERGVIDGSVPTVKPHPHFRLILTMDPHHGELSRAMRNRGIEICILGETEPASGFDSYDTRVMLHDRGIECRLVSDTLLSLHAALHRACAETCGVNVLTTSQLLHCAQLAAQSLELGVDTETALADAALDVCVRAARDRTTVKAIRSTIARELPILLQSCHQPTIETRSLTAVLPSAVPDATDYCSDVALATVRSTCSLFLHLLSNAVNVGHDVQTVQSSPATQLQQCVDCLSASLPTDKTIHALLPASGLLLANCPVGSLPLLTAYLRQSLTVGSTKNIDHFSVDFESGLAFTRCLPDIVIQPLRAVTNHPNVTKLEELARLIVDNDVDLWRQHAFDLRWNTALINKLKAKLENAAMDEDVWQQMAGLSNQLYLVYEWSQNQLIYSRLLHDERHWSVSVRQLANASLLQLSAAFHAGTSPLCRHFRHPALGHLLTLASDLVSEVGSKLAELGSMSDGDFAQLTEQFNWLRYFLRICSRPIGRRSTDECVAELALHWGWLHAKLLLPLQSVGFTFSPRLAETIYQLRSLLGADGLAAKLQEGLRSLRGQPRPFRYASEAESFITAFKVCRRLDRQIDIDETEDLQPAKVSLEPSIQLVKLELVNSLGKLGMDDEAVEKVISSSGTLSTALTSSGDFSASEMEARLTLQPVFHYLAVCHAAALAVGVADKSLKPTIDELQHFVKFCCHRTTLSPLSLVSMLSAKNTNDVMAVVCDVLSCLSGPVISKTIQDGTPLQVVSNVGLKSCSLSRALLPILFDDSSTDESNLVHLSLPSNVTLGDSDTRMLQLSTLSLALWTNAEFVSGKCSNLLRNDRILLELTVKHLLQMLKDLLPERIQGIVSQFIAGQVSISALVNCLTLIDSSDASKLSQLVSGWSNQLTNCLKNLTEICVDGNRGYSNLAKLGHVWTQVGQLQMALLAPRGPVDPSYRISTRLTYAKEETERIQCSFDMQIWQEELLSGVSELSLHHPHIMQMLQRFKKLKQWIADKSDMVAFRPDTTKFLNLLRDVEQFQSGIGAAERVSCLATKLLEVSQATPVEKDALGVLDEYRTLSAATRAFMSRVESDYLAYRDLVVPFLNSVTQTLHGLDLMATALEISIARHRIFRGSSAHRLEEIVCHLGSFPAMSVLPTFDRQELVSKRVLGIVSHVGDIADGNSDVETGMTSIQMQSSALKSCLLHVSNWAVHCGSLDLVTFDLLNSIFQHYVDLWNRLEEERKRKEAEDSSLYRYRTETFGDGLNEDERDERAIKLRFPSFEQDFEDIENAEFGIDADTQPQTGNVESSKKMKMLTLSESDMMMLRSIHGSLFTHLTSTSYHQGEPQCLPRIDLLQPVLLNYRISNELLHKFADLLDASLEKDLLGGHLLATAVLQKVVQTDGNTDGGNTALQSALLRAQEKSLTASSKSSVSLTYDIYRDSNVSEVVLCRPLLDGLVKHVNELLLAFVDHPTLRQILHVVSRIKSFQVTSPLTRFIAGLEMLMQVSQLWDRDAPTSLKLTAELTPIVELVKRWRKIEYRCWESCLDSIVHRVHQGASRWWFHIYRLLQPYIDCQTVDEKSENLAELLRALETFMEGSSVGEYQTRLEILVAFHLHLSHLRQPSNSLVKVENLFWNVYQFYRQFVPSIETFLATNRKSVEDLIKGAVKSVPWTRRDVNYFNYDIVKQEITKVHRALHRNMKTFQEHLQQPVTSLLTDAETDWTKPNSVRSLVSSTLVPKFCVDQTEFASESDELMLKYRRRMSKHCRRLMTGSVYSRRADTLNEFTGDVIERVHELQSLKVDETKEKAKQKSEAKHIVHRRRAALVDLFKTLELLGLSFKKGLAKLNSVADIDTMLSCFTVSPCDIAVALNQLQSDRCDEVTSTLWQGCLCTGNCSCHLWKGCEKYFVRCISRRRLFQTLLQTPSKDLEHGTMDRCRGFAEHLMLEMMEQKRHLVDQVNSFVDLRTLLQNVRQLNQSTQLPSQDQSSQLLLVLSVTVNRALHCLKQLQLLLDCAPSSQSKTVDSDVAVAPVVTSSLSHLAQVTHGDELWTTANNALQECVTSLNIVQNWTKTHVRTDRIVTFELMETAAVHVVNMNTTSSKLLELRRLCSDSATGDTWCLGTSLDSVVTEIKSVVARFETFTREGDANMDTVCHDPENMEPVSASVEPADEEIDLKYTRLRESIMLIIQTLIKKQEVMNKHEPSSDTCPDAEKCSVDADDEEFEKDLLTLKLGKTLKDDFSLLKINVVTRQLQLLVNEAVTPSPRGTTSLALRRLCDLVPALTQYSRLVQFYVTEHINAVRAMAKLLSVLLAVFSSLAQKGFCPPAELSDEMQQEGATKFEDIEGGGIGEGEGVKDVSDQIESEDQVEGTKKSGENEDKESNDQPDIAGEDNAIEMTDEFEGKLHDLEADDGKESGSDEEPDNEAEKELDEQLGDLGNDECEKLDEQMWGSDDEEPVQSEKEEQGPGAGQQSEPELAAKDDTGDQPKNNDDKKNKEKTTDKQSQDEEIPQPQCLDESEFDELEPNKAPPPDQQTAEEKEAEMELPEDLNLDEDGPGKEEGNADDTEVDETDLDKQLEEMENKEDKDTENKETENEETVDGKDENQPEENHENMEDEAMDAEEQNPTEPGEEKLDGNKEEEQEGESTGQQGLQAQADESETGGEDEKLEQVNEGMKTEHTTTDVQQVEAAQDVAGSSSQQQHEQEAGGVAQADDDSGHQGNDSRTVMSGANGQDQRWTQRRPGASSENRTVGNTDENVRKNLKTVENVTQELKPEQQQSQSKSDVYEHIRDATSRFDAQTMDAATENQRQLMQQSSPPPDHTENTEEDMEQAQMPPEDEEITEAPEAMKMNAAKVAESASGKQSMEDGRMEDGEKTVEEDGEMVATMSVEERPESTIHTNYDLIASFAGPEFNMEKMRQILEEEIQTLPRGSPEEEREALVVWHHYDALTSSLAQELCEQLRMVLAPTLAAKFKGGFRTGKRPCMRRVIEYIASDFRKDKFWLRRVEPSKRQYQVMVAIDDSASMVFNHSKQLAFESLAVIANALMKLEVGNIGVCSFGRTTKILHPLNEIFTTESGANILRQLTFEQQQTNVVQLLESMTDQMVKARHQLRRGSAITTETSQLLLVVSDGRCLGDRSKVKAAVRRAREAQIFLVFVVLDNPGKEDIFKMTLFEYEEDPKTSKKVMKLSNYMESFPFPFYVVIRDVTALPSTLSDALRQWFELVTATDR